MPQEDDAALLSLYGTFLGGRRHRKKFSMLLVLCVWEGLGSEEQWQSPSPWHQGISVCGRCPRVLVQPTAVTLWNFLVDAKEKNSTWTQYQGPRGEEAQGGQRNHPGHNQPVGRV